MRRWPLLATIRPVSTIGMNGMGTSHGSVRPAAPRKPGSSPSVRRTTRSPVTALPRLKPVAMVRATWFRTMRMVTVQITSGLMARPPSSVV